MRLFGEKVPSDFVNQLHFGDNLVRLRGEGVDKSIPDEVADLIYLDPPFNSARNYNLLFKQHKGQDSPAQIMTFEDTWTYSEYLYIEFKSNSKNSNLFELVDSLHHILGKSEMMAYLLMMAPRLQELHNKLKPTGSMYLHCDPVASHYLKIILDVIFGPASFQNEIIWKRTLPHGNVRKKFGSSHDTLLAYSKTDKAKWHPQYIPHREEYVKDFYRFKEGDRKYRLISCINPNPDRPNLTYEWNGVTRVWKYTRERMQAMHDAGLLVYSKSGIPSYKGFLDAMKGTSMQDIWDDIPPLMGSSRERRGYPTQKPLALLERIIAATTDEGDVVLDPFAGCGTAVVAAERMRRRWIGIDVTYLAINEIVDRLSAEKQEGVDLRYELLGTPKDEGAAIALFESTAKQNHKPFEQWAVTLVNGKWNDKRGADRGVDGRIQLWDMNQNYKEGVVQVKGGTGLTLSAVRDFGRVIDRENAVLGVLITQREPTREMLLEAESLGYANWPGQRRIPRYQILTTRGILELGEKAVLPESWLIKPDLGVGRAVRSHSESLFEDL